MSNLELKVPPVLLVVIFAIGMWWVAQLTGQQMLLIDLKWLLSPFFAVTGVVFPLMGVISFKRAETTVNPVTPNASTALVTSGIYRYSRNPMYVGFLFLLMAWGLLLANIWAILLTVFFVFYLSRFQIQPEEKALRNSFGAAFYDYEQRVRRWL
ncbi:methyltransferase family protein [Alkalimarinus sediminis]|uniref:Isoprenylcysteine carboxylmethyltransferase family protein n=1 Tax=Alkalimarinus sediminis TaxID=1632866 RepID=A0A9E8HLB5_9ALTE|nr:isoprenylcysteine carboxylmethyltransferase family protein [Alkalimarinus sediminis]UZW76569.1 isoprenylcysteine carboxylmethyltransferase family protein [Alkalimarinus sediminis]